MVSVFILDLLILVSKRGALMPHDLFKRHHDEGGKQYDEQNILDLHGLRGDAAEAQSLGDYDDAEQCGGVTPHGNARYVRNAPRINTHTALRPLMTLNKTTTRAITSRM